MDNEDVDNEDDEYDDEDDNNDSDDDDDDDDDDAWWMVPPRETQGANQIPGVGPLRPWALGPKDTPWAPTSKHTGNKLRTPTLYAKSLGPGDPRVP